jgi:hypothetical protein
MTKHFNRPFDLRNMKLNSHKCDQLSQTFKMLKIHVVARDEDQKITYNKLHFTRGNLVTSKYVMFLSLGTGQKLEICSQFSWFSIRKSQYLSLSIFCSLSGPSRENRYARRKRNHLRHRWRRHQSWRY